MRPALLGSIVLFSIFSIFSLFSGGPARAALGGNVASVQKDAQALGVQGSQITDTHRPDYDRYEISRSWLKLREFVGPGGNVFALAWSGRRHPDLRHLLGSHFGEFQAALAQARRERRRGGAIVVDSGNLHLEIGGHMMSVYGVIWLKDQLPGGPDGPPEGMNVNEIR